MIIEAFQNKIDLLKKDIQYKNNEITAYKELIKLYSGDITTSFVPGIPLAKNGKETNWVARIQAILSESEMPLTSREILDLMYDKFTDLEREGQYMGSLSSALKNNSGELKPFKKHKKEGEFARFEINSDYIE